MILTLLVFWLTGVQVYNVIFLERGYSRISGLLESIEDLRQSTTTAELYEAKYFVAMSAEVYRLPYTQDSKKSKSSCDLEQYLAEAGWLLLSPFGQMPAKPKKDVRQKAKFDGGGS